MATTGDRIEHEISPVFDQAEAERLGLPPIRFLSDEEWAELVDRRAQHDFGVSAEEFSRRYRAGEFDDHHHPEHCKAISLAMMIPGLVWE